LKKHKLKTKFNEAKYSLGFLVWKSSNKLQRLHRASLKDLDLTPTQFSPYRTLVRVLPEPNPKKQNGMPIFATQSQLKTTIFSRKIAKNVTYFF